MEMDNPPEDETKRGQYIGEWFDEDWLDEVDEEDWLDECDTGHYFDTDDNGGDWMDGSDVGDWADAGFKADWQDWAEVNTGGQPRAEAEGRNAATGEGEKQGEQKQCTPSYLVGGNWIDDPMGLVEKRPAWHQQRLSALEGAASILLGMKEGVQRVS
jgi:hypothetical protein